MSLISWEDAFKKGYLENKKIILKPSPRGGKMISDPRHIAYFKIDGATTAFCLPRNNRGDLVKVFKNDEERKFFENELGLELNESKPGNHFEKMTVVVTKDATLMHSGEIFDMSKPMDNLRVRILSKDRSIADSWEERLNRPEYQWALIDESKINKEAEKEFDSNQEFWMYIGKIKDDTPKLRTTLSVYFATIGSSKKILIDTSKEAMMKEVNNISVNNSERENFVTIINDTLFSSKVLVLQSLTSGAISKEGNDVYCFTGDSATHTFNEMATKLKQLKDDQDDLYFKIISQLEKISE